MDKKVSTIIIAIVIIAVVGLLIWSGGKNQTAVVSTDDHGHSSTNTVATEFKDYLDKPVPEYSFADRNGKIYSSENLRGKNVILFFNEGLMCYPACWNQIVALAKDERLNQDDTVVLSVVVDPPEEWQKAIDKMPELAEATVVFDKDAEISRKFGMLTVASSMHYGSLPGHTYVLIDKDGVVKHIFDDPNMSIHNDQLVAEIAKLN